MKLKQLYLLLCILGVVVPYSQFIPFLREHGLDLALFCQELFSTRVGAFFGLDVFVSSLVLWVFILTEGRTRRVKHLWAPIVASLGVGVSLGLPLFLYLRETSVERASGKE